MDPIHLHYVWQYTDVDRAFWQEHLEGWVPDTIIDAHTHVGDPAFRKEPVTDEMRRQYWVGEVSEPIDAADADRCIGMVFPNRRVTCVAMGWPSLAYDLDGLNECLAAQCAARGWHALSICPPAWDADRVNAELDRPGVIGLKPYYSLISADRTTRDKHLEAGIFEFLPHHVLEVADERRAWVTLHVPRADRLGHPDNIREIKELRARYPNVVLVIAHLGRSYTDPHARESLPQLADDPGLHFDFSAVLNPDVLRFALECIGPERMLYGTDNPVFYMRGRRQWEGRTYINRTNQPFHFNKEREAPEIEATYTLYMYEALKALKGACEDLNLGRAEVEALLRGNAERLLGRALRSDTHSRQ